MRSPPLNQLKAFEATGRLGSVVKAADELNVTASAISQQIKALEFHLKFPLFIRRNKKIDLTGNGRIYWESINQALTLVDGATKRLFAEENERPLRIHCARSFLRRWLMPRLPDFYDSFPHEEIQILTFGRGEDETPANIDVSIRLGDGWWPDFVCDQLIPIELTPICSPKYLKSHPPIHKPSDMCEQMLVHAIGRETDWINWLSSAGVNRVNLAHGINLDGETLEYEAAIAGLGIALGRKGFYELDVAQGRLVTPFDLHWKAAGAYYLIYPRQRERSRKLTLFRHWLLSQIPGSERYDKQD